MEEPGSMHCRRIPVGRHPDVESDDEDSNGEKVDEAANPHGLVVWIGDYRRLLGEIWYLVEEVRVDVE